MALRPPARPQAATGGSVNFGDMGFYAAGFNIPPGTYAMLHEVVLQTPTKKDGTPTGAAFLGAKLTAYPLNGGEPVEKVLSMGTKAHLGFQPSADGKGLEPIPNGAGTPSASSNWGIYLQSMYDCGLPKGILVNDFTVLDGVHVVVTNVPEPEERKGFGGAKTGDVEPEQRGPRMIPIVTEIKADGKPWEGKGGFPEAASAPQAAPARPAAPARAAAPRPNGKATAPAPTAETLDENALETAAVTAAADILEKSPDGLLKVRFRTDFFKKVTDAVGADNAQVIVDTYAKDDATLGTFLSALDYTIGGMKVVPVQR